MTPAEICDMTLPEIAAYLEGWQANRRTQAMYWGTLTAAVYNTVPSRTKRKPLTWSDIYRIGPNRPYDAAEKWDELKRAFPPKQT